MSGSKVSPEVKRLQKDIQTLRLVSANEIAKVNDELNNVKAERDQAVTSMQVLEKQCADLENSLREAERDIDQKIANEVSLENLASGSKAKADKAEQAIKTTLEFMVNQAQGLNGSMEVIQSLQDAARNFTRETA